MKPCTAQAKSSFLEWFALGDLSSGKTSSLFCSLLSELGVIDYLQPCDFLRTDQSPGFIIMDFELFWLAHLLVFLGMKQCDFCVDAPVCSNGSSIDSLYGDSCESYLEILFALASLIIHFYFNR